MEIMEVIESALLTSKPIYYMFEGDNFYFCAKPELGYTAHDDSPEAWAAFESKLTIYCARVGIDFDAEACWSLRKKRKGTSNQRSSERPDETGSRSYEAWKQEFYEPRDVGKHSGHMIRENGRFGSLPIYDDHGDDSDAS